MIKSICLNSFFFFLTITVAVGQNYKTCLITDLVHWGVKDEVFNGIPDYFSSDSVWIQKIKEHVTSLVIEKFDVNNVKFLNPGVQIKDGNEESNWGSNLDSVDRTQADLFVSVSSHASYLFDLHEMVIEVEVENKSEKRVYRQKSKLFVKPQANETGIETNIDIGQADYKTFFHSLLEAAFLADKKSRKLGSKNVKRVQTNEYDDFLANADQCNISTSVGKTWGRQIEFLGKRENVEIEVKGKNVRVNDSDSFINKKKEKRGFKLISNSLLSENWKVKYELDEKLGLLKVFWEMTHFRADILSEEKELLGHVSFFASDTLSANIRTDTISLNWVYHNSIVEVYKNQELSALAQIPKDYDAPVVKFFFLRDLKEEELGTLLSLFLLNREFKKL